VWVSRDAGAATIARAAAVRRRHNRLAPSAAPIARIGMRKIR
jgi:hypothetical protein